MKMRLFCPGLVMGVLTACIPLATFAENTPSALKELESAIRKEAGEKKPVAEGEYAREPLRPNGLAANIPYLIAQLEMAVARNDWHQVEQVINQIAATSSSKTVREAAGKLRDAVRADSEAKDKAAIAEIDSVLDATSKAVQAASKPSDLDRSLRDLDNFKNRGNGRESGKVRTEWEKLNSTRQFLVNWQDYLANLKAGNTKEALESLKKARNANADFLLPRSTVLERINGLSVVPTADRVREIMAKVKSLDEIPSALAALDKLGSDQDGPQNEAHDIIPALSHLLDSIQRTYQNYKAGLPTEMSVGPIKINGAPVNREAESLALPLRIKLMQLTFPRFLGVTDRPKTNESIQEYLDRILADASSRLDARVMERVVELMNKLDGKNDPAPAAFATLISAQNQDEAGQFALAVISYESALKTGGDKIPAKAIGTRIQAIKSAHPEEYKEGMAKFMAGAETPQASKFGRFGSPSDTSIRVPGAVPANPR